MSESRSIEVKVGMLILIGLGLLAALVLVMGRITFQKRFTLYVDFENPGAIQPGAAVKIAGVRVGSVEELEFHASSPDPVTGRRPLVRAKISVEERYHKEIRTTSEFYVTTLGILGEQFLAIDPGTGGEIIPEGKVVLGLGPPRIDLFVARAYTLLDDTVNAIQSNRETLHGIVQDLAGVLRNANQLLARNGGRVDALLADSDQLVKDIDVTVKDVDTTVNDARNKYVNNPQIGRILDRAEHVAGSADRVISSVERDVPALLRDVRQTTGNANRLLNGIGDAQMEDVRTSLHNVRTLTEQANGIATNAQRLMTHVQQGRGTIGALLMDEEVYDDLQELVRDLKHNPWKFFWRE